MLTKGKKHNFIKLARAHVSERQISPLWSNIKLPTVDLQSNELCAQRVQALFITHHSQRMFKIYTPLFHQGEKPTFKIYNLLYIIMYISSGQSNISQS